MRRIGEGDSVGCATTIGAQTGVAVWVHGGTVRVKTEENGTFEVNINDVWLLEAPPPQEEARVVLRFEARPRVAHCIAGFLECLHEWDWKPDTLVSIQGPHQVPSPDMVGQVKQCGLGRTNDVVTFSIKHNYPGSNLDLPRMSLPVYNAVITPDAPGIPVDTLAGLLREYLSKSGWDLKTPGYGWTAYIRLDSKGRLTVTWNVARGVGQVLEAKV